MPKGGGGGGTQSFEVPGSFSHSHGGWGAKGSLLKGGPKSCTLS